jgi:uncharacterized protein
MGAFWKRWAIRVVRIAVAAYLGLTLVLFLWQDSFIFPGAATQGQAEATLHAGADSELLELRSKNGTKITALFGKASVGDSAHALSVIFFYGNGACLAYSTDIFDHFRQLGVNVIIPDYEGYGMSGGRPSEAGCYAAADAAMGDSRMMYVNEAMDVGSKVESVAAVYAELAKDSELAAAIAQYNLTN